MRMDGHRALGDCDVEDAGTVTQFGSRASARKSGNDARCACEDGGGIGGMGHRGDDAGCARERAKNT